MKLKNEMEHNTDNETFSHLITSKTDINMNERK